MASSPRRSSDADGAIPGIVGRARRASLSALNANFQLGIWQAAGTAIAQAPNLSELRDMGMGGNNITFNSQSRSARLAAVYEYTGRLALVRSNTGALDAVVTKEDKPDAAVSETEDAASVDQAGDNRHHHRRHHLWRHRFGESHGKEAPLPIGPTVMHGLATFWRFFITPAGFLITIYCLNMVVSLSSTINPALGEATGLHYRLLLGRQYIAVPDSSCIPASPALNSSLRGPYGYRFVAADSACASISLMAITSCTSTGASAKVFVIHHLRGIMRTCVAEL